MIMINSLLELTPMCGATAYQHAHVSFNYYSLTVPSYHFALLMTREIESIKSLRHWLEINTLFSLTVSLVTLHTHTYTRPILQRSTFIFGLMSDPTPLKPLTEHSCVCWFTRLHYAFTQSPPLSLSYSLHTHTPHTHTLVCHFAVSLQLLSRSPSLTHSFFFSHHFFLSFSLVPIWNCTSAPKPLAFIFLNI